MRTLLIFSLSVFLTTFLHAKLPNQSLKDSLLDKLAISGASPQQADILNALAAVCRNNNPESSLEFSGRASALSKKLDYAAGMAEAEVLAGIANSNMGNYQEAKHRFDQALEISQDKNELRIASRAYNNRGLLYDNLGNYAAAMNDYSAALKIQETIQDKREIAAAYSNMGFTFESLGRFDEALKNQTTALIIYQEIGHAEGIATSLNYLAMVHIRQGDYTFAMKNFLAALKTATETGDTLNMAYAHVNIGTLYYFQGNYPLSFNSSLTALNLYQKMKNRKGIAISYTGLSAVYHYQGNDEEGLKYNSKALNILLEIGDKRNTGICYNNAGFIYKSKGEYSEAMKNLMVAIRIFEEISDRYMTAETYESIGESHFAMKNYKEAIQWLNKAVKAALEINAKRVVKECYFALAETFEESGDSKSAYKYSKLYSGIKEIIDEESSKKIAEMKSQYETALKDDEIKLLNKDKEVREQLEKRQAIVRNAFIGGFAIVLLFAGVFLYQRNKISHEKRKSDAEKQRSDELLLNILPYEVAEELKTTGTAKAKTYSLVSVMFTDFRNFTSISEMVSAELLVAEIHFCFSAFDAIMQKYKIEKIKTVGDAYIAAAGLPELSFTHAADCVKAALEIRDFMIGRKKEKEIKGEIPFEIRIGIHTGPVVAGVVGVKKFAFDIWGDTVNLAARMEQNCEPGKINISDITYQLVKNQFDCFYRGKVNAKNKGEIDMYFVEAKTEFS